MENAPEAPAEAPKAPESEAPQTTNTEQAETTQAPDMHGFTSEQLAEMRKFYDANGGFEKVKSKISNPEKPVETTEKLPEKTVEEPTSQPQAQEPQYKTPTGAITAQEFLAEQYFKALAGAVATITLLYNFSPTPCPRSSQSMCMRVH